MLKIGLSSKKSTLQRAMNQFIELQFFSCRIILKLLEINFFIKEAHHI